MTELDELEVGIGRLKKASNEQKKFIEELKKERGFLIKKNNEIAVSIKGIQEQIKPTGPEINELKKELEGVTVLVQEMKNKESKLNSMLTEQKSNLFLLRSGFEKNLDRLSEDIEGRIRENKRIELTRFNELKSKIEKLAGIEDQLKEQSKDQRVVMNKLIQDVSKLQQTVTGLTSENLDAELENLRKRISSETKSLVKQITGDTEIVLGLRDRLQYFEPVVKDFSKKLESQEALLNKVMESKEFLSKKSDVLEGELKSLNKEISIERERIAKLEQDRESHNYEKETENLTRELKSLEEKISSEGEKIAVLEDGRETSKKDIEEMKEHLESTFQQTLQGKAKELESDMISKSKNLEEDLKYLTKELSLKKDKMVVLEQDLKNQEKNQDSKTKELADSIGGIRINEARREENFNSMVGRLKELQIRTENSLKSLNEKITQISKIEGNLERKIHKENDAIFKRLGSSYDELDERALKSENTISKLSESVKGLGKKAEEQFMLVNETGKKLSLLEQDVGEHSKNQESQVKDLGSLTDIMNDVEERISNSEKTISKLDTLTNRIETLEKESQTMDDLEKRITNLDKKLSGSENTVSNVAKEISSGKERISVLEKDNEEMKKQIESGFQQSVPGKIRELESDLTDKTKNLTRELKSLEEKISSEGEKIAVLEDGRETSKKDIEEMKEHLESTFQQTLQGKAKELESDMISKSKNLEEDLKYLTKELSSGKERISLMEQDLKNQFIDRKSKTKELEGLVKGLGNLDERVSDSEKLISRISDTVTEMRTRIMDDEEITKKFEEQSKVIDKVTNAGERLTRIEEKVKAQTKDQDMRFSEVIAVIKDLELGEAKRIEEFNSFVERFQKLRMKTKQNLGLFDQNVKKLSDIKGEIKSEISKENTVKLKEFGLEFNAFRNRVNATEELLIQLNDTLEELRLSLDGMGGKTISIETGLKNLTEKLGVEKEKSMSLEERIKSQEDSRELMFANVSNLIRDMEAGEANRVREYNKFIEKFQGMNAKTDEFIKSIRRDANLFKKMNSDFTSREASINENLNTFKEDISSRIKTNEEMYDSEMDEFKNKLDYIVKELVAFKRTQEPHGILVDSSKKEKPAETLTMAEPVETEKNIIKKPETKPISYQENP